MRPRRPTLFFSFAATAAAMEAERLCRAAGQPGRLVPVPRQITAGCGLAWMASPEDGEALRAFFKAEGLEYEGCHLIEF
ncbi:MAG: DUF3343 domain-containing protein [Oscillospiraceae bacterium]|nr:DUF3343 domain-containing protein [Oscillospiraceae bacterium]